jgi:3-oxoacyl-[acyl-carrier-protein] synthase II
MTSEIAITERRAPQDIQQRRANSQTRLRAPRKGVLALQEVVVTGVGVILPGCDNRTQLWRQLSSGESQLRIEPDPADQIRCAIGRVHDFDCSRYLAELPKHLYAACHREQQFYLSSVVQACRDAGLLLEDMASERVGLFDGTSRGSFAFWYELIRSKVEGAGTRFTPRDLNHGMPGQAVGITAAMLGVKGPTETVSGTCASGAIAIGKAFREVEAGRADIAFGTGHDVALIGPLFEMYRDANLLSAEEHDAARAVQPYTGNSANAFGEGAVTLVLETRRHAEARGAEILAEIVSYGHGNGGDHPTDVDFVGERPARLMTQALEEAGLAPPDVDFVLGHGNGVLGSDISELNYMKRVFGRRTREVPLISTKPIYGHTLGASSALNAAAAALMLHNDFVIPTINIDERRVVHGFNHQANRGAPRALRSGVVMTYGMGGQNATLVLRKVNS